MASSEEVLFAENSTGYSNETGFYNESGFFNVSGTGEDESDGGVISLNFIDSFVKSISVMVVSELGDKTFFLAGNVEVYYFIIFKKAKLFQIRSHYPSYN